MRRGLKPAWHPLAMATIQKAGGMSLASMRTYSAALHAVPAVAAKYGITTGIQAGFDNSTFSTSSASWTSRGRVFG
jgi:hypothetical protein